MTTSVRVTASQSSQWIRPYHGQYAKGWREASEVEGWGVTEGMIEELLNA